MNLLFLGDSITDCGRLFEPDGLGDGYVRMIFEELSSTIPGLSVYNKGVDGFTVPRVYAMWQSLPLNLRERFDMVTVLAGINDVSLWMETGTFPRTPRRGDGASMRAEAGTLPSALPDLLQEFARVYEDLAADILDCGIPRVILVEPFIFRSPQEYLRWRPLVAQVSSLIRGIAETYRLDFLPLQETLDRHAETDGIGRITPDGIHLTQTGNRVLAREWIRLAGL